MEKLNDTWYRIIGIPVVSLVINIIFYYDMNERHGFGFLEDYLYTVATAYLVWEVNRRIILYTRNKYRLYTQSKQRIITTAVCIVLSTAGTMTLISLFYDLTNWWGYAYTAKNYFFNIFSAVTYAVIVCGIYEASYYFKKWRTVELQAEMLKKENLQSQLESLKQQVNPHFLFNSLNTLSSLIRKDVDRAEAFLDELSKVYRYLLRTNEGELTDLATELQFIQSFFHLMKTRYGNALQMELHINEEAKSRLLPPLTLQLLVENAIKHNRVDKLHPLLIRIETDQQGRLLVKNNLQKKMVSLPSNKIGLGNISAKYKLLGQPGIGITETETDFIVTIPLLKTYEYEHTDRGR